MNQNKISPIKGRKKCGGRMIPYSQFDDGICLRKCELCGGQKYTANTHCENLTIKVK